MRVWSPSSLSTSGQQCSASVVRNTHVFELPALIVPRVDILLRPTFTYLEIVLHVCVSLSALVSGG